MLEVNRAEGKMTHLERTSMKDADWMETLHLQKLIHNNPEAFFEKECGEHLFVVAKEFPPSKKFSDEKRRIDLLAIDAKGKTVIVEARARPARTAASSKLCRIDIGRSGMGF